MAIDDCSEIKLRAPKIAKLDADQPAAWKRLAPSERSSLMQINTAAFELTTVGSGKVPTAPGIDGRAIFAIAKE
jgi:hypothetical protein